MNYIKISNRPLLIVIDGFENLSEEQKELNHFLEFLSSIPEIKIIIAGREVSFSSLKAEPFEIRLGGLGENEAYKILKDNGIEETESGLHQIFQVTRGYPENLLWFSNAIDILKISSFDLLQEYYSENQKSFEEFIYEKLYNSIPSEFLKIIHLFAVIRHSLTIETLEKLDFIPDIIEKTNYLTSKMILTQNKSVFYIKSLLKNTIYSNISAEEKKQIHKYLYELYSEQISKKLEERIFSVSRKLLYSEQYYHYMCLINCGDKSLPDLKTTNLSNLKPEFKYLSVNITDNLFIGNKENSSQTIEISESKKQKTSETILNTDIDIISDLEIELSEDEKALLSEESTLNEVATVSPEKQPGQILRFSQNDKKAQVDNNKTSIGLENEFSQQPLAKQAVSAYTPASQLKEKVVNLETEANIFYEQGKFDEAAKKFKEALILYEILRDRSSINHTLISIANAYSEGFRHDVALMYYYRVLNTEDATMETEPKIEALCGIADIYDYREDFENALKFYQKALEEAEKSNNIKQKANICFKKALAYDDIGDFDRALEFYLKNTNISDSIEINPNVAAAYANIAAIYEERGNINNAKKCYSESLKFDKLMNNKEGQYETLSSIGYIHFEMFDYQNANNYFHEALAIAKSTGDAYKIAMSCLDIGDISLQEKNYEKALKAFIIARKTIEKTISTDSKEKIDRRFKKIISEIGEQKFKLIIEKLKKKHE